MAAIDTRKVSITDDDRGPVVNIVSWMCIVTMVFAVLTRLSLRLTASMRIAVDDVAVTLAAIFAIAHTVTLSKQVDFGLGERMNSLSAAQLTGYQKSEYASDLLYVCAICFSKLSTATLLHNLTPAKNWKKIIGGFAVFVGVWTLATFLAVAFQCPFPRPWSTLSDQCFNQTTFWHVTGSIDILTESFMVAIPVLFVKDLHMGTHRKLIVIFAFSFRVLVIAATATRLYQLSSALSSPDRTFDSHRFAITTQLAITLSVAVSCIPFLKSVMENMQSGLISNHGQHAAAAAAAASATNSGSYPMKNLSHARSMPETVVRVQPMQQKGAVAVAQDDHNYLRDSESVTSVGSTNNIIKKPAGGVGDGGGGGGGGDRR